jgi:DNA polymerase
MPDRKGTKPRRTRTTASATDKPAARKRTPAKSPPKTARARRVVPEPEPGVDAARARRAARKLSIQQRPTEGNTMFVPANNLLELSEQIKLCTRCKLSQTRTQAVPGEGPEAAQIMFIGEAPGFNEDRQGRPFVGAAGNFLNDLLAQIGLKREDVYITNVVKSRPPQNRDPEPDEIEACRIWLDKQIEIIQPKVIVTISRYAMVRWFPDKKISEIHGKARRFGDLVVVPMYHPAAALHQQSLRRVIEEDFKKLPEYIKYPSRVPSGDGSSKQQPPGEQLKMF